MSADRKNAVGTVETVEEMKDTHWLAVKLEGNEEVFALHRNWIRRHGALKPGDRVRYLTSKGDWRTEGHPHFDELRKVEKEEGSREELEVKPGL